MTAEYFITRTLFLIAPLLLLGVPGTGAVVVLLRPLPALPRPPAESPSARQGAVAPRGPRGPLGARQFVARPGSENGAINLHLL